MKRTLAVVVFALVIVSSVQAQYLEKAYFGAVYVNTMPANKEYYRSQNDIFPLAAIKAIFPVGYGQLRFRVVHDFKNPAGNYWWERDTSSSINFKMGNFPRPIAEMSRPEIVSPQGNFESPFHKVIPGDALGAMISFSSKKLGSNLMAGAYNADGHTELNLGFQQNFDSSSSSFSFSGYSNNQSKISGAAFSGKLGNFSLMLFQGREQSKETYSGLCCLDLPKDSGISLGVLRQEKKWDIVRFVAYRSVSERIGVAKIGHFYGVGYECSEIRPPTILIFLQTWINK